jgi:hypothetical protein
MRILFTPFIHVFFILTILAQIATPQPVDPPCPTHELKRFTINMDLPVNERYVEIATYGKPHLMGVLNFIDSKLPVPEFMYTAIGWLAHRLDPV